MLATERARINYLRRQARGMIEQGEDNPRDETFHLRAMLAHDVLAILDGRRDEFLEDEDFDEGSDRP